MKISEYLGVNLTVDSYLSSPYHGVRSDVRLPFILPYDFRLNIEATLSVCSAVLD